MDIEQIKADREAGTPTLGGWAWYGGRDEVKLCTKNGGRQYIMTFERKGLNGAQPCFQVNGLMKKAVDFLTMYTVGDGTARGQKQADNDQTVYRMDVCGIDHPDARRIARVPDLEAQVIADADRIAALEAENKALREELEWQPIEEAPKDVLSILWSDKLKKHIIADWAGYTGYNQPRFTHFMRLQFPPNSANHSKGSE